MIGLPCSEAEFVDRLAAPASAQSDYLAQFDRPDLPPAPREAHWRDQWRRGADRMIGSPYRMLSERAQSLGCTVIRRATLADLRVAAAQAQVIIVVAHWKDAEFPAGDFLPTFEAVFDERLAARSEPLARWLQQAVRPRRLIFWERPGTGAREAVRQSLSAAIGGEARIELPRTTAARRRDMIDSWFSDCLRPGNRLELFDGLHSRDAVADALAGFTGVVDLTICTSTYLGDHIGARSRQQTHTVQFPELQEPMEAAFRLLQVLQLAVRHPLSPDHYLSHRTTVGALFPLAVQQALAERGGSSE